MNLVVQLITILMIITIIIMIITIIVVILKMISKEETFCGGKKGAGTFYSH